MNKYDKKQYSELTKKIQLNLIDDILNLLIPDFSTSIKREAYIEIRQQIQRLRKEIEYK